jgi:hypothetical protein
MTQHKARPTTYKGVKMRSRLEAGFAAWLDKHHFTWEYEPQAFASSDGQYLPDFRLANAYTSWSPQPVTVYIEVKPKSFMYGGTGMQIFEDADILGRQAAILAESEPDAVLIMMQPTEPKHPCPAYALFRSVDGDFLPYPLDLIWLPKGRTGGEIGFGKHVVTDPWSFQYWKPKPS